MKKICRAKRKGMTKDVVRIRIQNIDTVIIS